MIQETGTLDDMRKKALLDVLKQYAQSVAPAIEAQKTGEKAASNVTGGQRADTP